jgi:hypothetical protein
MAIWLTMAQPIGVKNIGWKCKAGSILILFNILTLLPDYLVFVAFSVVTTIIQFLVVKEVRRWQYDNRTIFNLTDSFSSDKEQTS